MVFQDSYSSLNPRMTMAESIAYAPRMHGLGRKEAYDRAEVLLAQVGQAISWVLLKTIFSKWVWQSSQTYS